MSVKSIPVVATVSPLAGKTAVELRALLSAKATTKKALIAFLSAKESLRAPSAKLLAELTGVAPVVATPAPKVVAPAKVATPAPKAAAPAKEMRALVARIVALEAALAALAPVVAKPAAKVAPMTLAAAKAAASVIGKK